MIQNSNKRRMYSGNTYTTVPDFNNLVMTTYLKL